MTRRSGSFAHRTKHFWLLLSGKYRQALATHGVNTLEASFQADREVQGADVKTLRTLEETIEALATNNRGQFQTVRQLQKICSAS